MSETRTQLPVTPDQGPDRRGRIIAGRVALVAASLTAILGTRLAIGYFGDSTADQVADNLWGADPTPPAASEYNPPQPRQPIEDTRSPTQATIGPTEPRPSPSAATAPEFTWRSCEANAAIDTETNSLLVGVEASFDGNLRASTDADPSGARVVALVEDHHSGIVFTEPVGEESVAEGRVEATLDSDGRFQWPAERVEIYMAEFPTGREPAFESGRNQPNPLENITNEEYYTLCGVFSVAANGTVEPIGG